MFNRNNLILWTSFLHLSASVGWKDEASNEIWTHESPKEKYKQSECWELNASNIQIKTTLMRKICHRKTTHTNIANISHKKCLSSTILLFQHQPVAQNGGYLHPPEQLGVFPESSGDNTSGNWQLATHYDNYIGNSHVDTHDYDNNIANAHLHHLQSFEWAVHIISAQIPSYRLKADNGYLHPRRQRFSKIGNTNYLSARPNFTCGYLEPF